MTRTIKIKTLCLHGCTDWSTQTNLSKVSSLSSGGAPSPKTNFFTLSTRRSVLVTSVLKNCLETDRETPFMAFSFASLHQFREAMDAILCYPQCLLLQTVVARVSNGRTRFTRVLTKDPLFAENKHRWKGGVNSYTNQGKNQFSKVCE